MTCMKMEESLLRFSTLTESETRRSFSDEWTSDMGGCHCQFSLISLVIEVDVQVDFSISRASSLLSVVNEISMRASNLS